MQHRETRRTFVLEDYFQDWSKTIYGRVVGTGTISASLYTKTNCASRRGKDATLATAQFVDLLEVGKRAHSRQHLNTTH